MSAPRADYRKHITRGVPVLTSLLKHVKTDTLALVLLVAQALLSATQGKHSETRESASLKATKTEVVIDQFGSSPKTLTVPAGATVTWTNHDNVTHVVTSADSQFQKSSGLKTEQALTNSFVTAETNSPKEAPVIITPSFTKDR